MAGLRVVRGPDWNLGNADKGEGHVGTVVNDNNNGTYDVVWDMGGKSNCRVGKDGKFDLRLLDNAPIGVKHSVKCQGCQKNIAGTLWKCAQCSDASLCSLCYFDDKHDVSHSFNRIDEPTADSVAVPKRSSSSTMKALGLFPGAMVTRGVDWQFGNQDGGIGKRGKVENIRPYGSSGGARNAVRVRWESSGEANVYRIGCNGKIDVTCAEEARGFSYYRDHLSVIGQKVAVRPTASASAKTRQTSAAGRTASSPKILQIGDKCVIDVEEAKLKEMQKDHGGWSISMAECIGQICTVKEFIGDSTIEVDFKGRSYSFNAGAVKKVHSLKVGDKVKVTGDENKAKLLQRSHGGWNGDMRQSLNRVGKVVKIDSDGDIAVEFGKQAWVFNPGLLTHAPGEALDRLEESESSAAAADKDEEVVYTLPQLLAKLHGRREMSSMSNITPDNMISAVANGNVELVRHIIQQKKEMVNCVWNSLTPLIVAANKGHERIVELLLDNGANINAITSKRITALHAAVAGGQEECSICLIKRKANVNILYDHNRSIVHIAAYEGRCRVLKVALEFKADPNLQDSAGDTPIHDAVFKKNDRAVAILLSHPGINLKLENNKGFNILKWAVFKDHEFAVERIIDKAPHLVNSQTDDEFGPLHVAAINDYESIAGLLILKGKANVNSKRQGGITPLHLAAHKASPGTARILITNGADVNAKSNGGNTPLHTVLAGEDNTGDLFTQLLRLTLNANTQLQERYNIACMLIDNGANVNIKNNGGATPIQVCGIDRLKQAVSNYIQKTRQQSQSQSANALQDLFEELIPVRCFVCKDTVANSRLLPCRHKVACVDCCMRVHTCPMCRSPVSERCDMQGRRIVDPCKVQ